MITNTGDTGDGQTSDQRTRWAQGPLLGVCVDKKCESVVRRKTSGQQRLQRQIRSGEYTCFCCYPAYGSSAVPLLVAKQ